MDENQTNKLKALAIHLGMTEEEAQECACLSDYDSNTFEIGAQEYLVLTDEEADERAREYILDTLWAFRSSYFLNFLGMCDAYASKALEKIQEGACESANPLLLAMIKGREDEFVEDAISADGRAHFLNTYDGHEYEEGGYFIYRMN